MAVDQELYDAIGVAHGAAECGDYYCGCWDVRSGSLYEKVLDLEVRWQHTEKFIAALRAAGYEIVKVRP